MYHKKNLAWSLAGVGRDALQFDSSLNREGLHVGQSVSFSVKAAKALVSFAAKAKVMFRAAGEGFFILFKLG